MSTTIPATLTALDSALYEAKNELQRNADIPSYHMMRPDLARSLGALVRAVETQQHEQVVDSITQLVCAECGTTTADTYVVTGALDDAEGRTEVCITCHRALVAGEAEQQAHRCEPTETPLERFRREHPNGAGSDREAELEAAEYMSREDRIDRARTILATEGLLANRSSFDGPGDIARLSAALRDMIELAYS